MARRRRCWCSATAARPARPDPQLNLGVQYWTSRGFAVVDVNYGGSTGYGRAYRGRLQRAVGRRRRRRLRGRRPLPRRDAARSIAERLAIRGGSAGGYTTLCALAFRDDFPAGASLFGVADLEALAQDTHKFESRYLDSLVGPYPAEPRPLPRARRPSTTSTASAARCILLQGLEDEIVPPAQSEMMVEARAEPRACRSPT